MTSPSGETSILSIPFGPRDVFKRFATVTAAKMLIYIMINNVKKEIDYVTYLMGFKTLDSLLLCLLSKDDVRSA
jgi:hypothetical protein